MIYQKILKYCEENNITVAELERKSGIGNGTIGKWNNGKIPSLKTLGKIEKATGIAVAELIET